MIAVTGIVLNQYKAFVVKGDILYLWSNVVPNNASNTKVSWKSSDPSVAIVDEHGVVYAQNTIGSCTVTVTTVDGEFTASCEINVQESVIPVQTISIIVPNGTFYHYDYVQLSTVITPEDATDKTIIWSSSNTSVATVDSTGKVYGDFYGNVTITARTEDSQCSTQIVVATDENGSILVDEFGNKLSDTIRVALSTTTDLTFLPVPVRGISFSESVYPVPVASKVQTTIIYDPPNADNKNVIYFSSDTDVTSVSKLGVAAGVAGGVAQVFAISEDGGHQAVCTIKVLGKYVPNISGFTLVATEKISSGIKYTFSFDHDALFLGGYDLEISYDQSTYTLAQFYIDTTLQAISKRGDTEHFISVTNSICEISYVLPSTSVVDGVCVYFKLRRLSINRSDRSAYTPAVCAYTYPSIPKVYSDDLYAVVSNNANMIKLKFNNIDIAAKNKDVKKILIYKHPLIEGSVLSLDSELSLESPDIKSGSTVVIHDYMKYSVWCGVSSEDNTINLSSILLQPYSNTYSESNKPYVHNLKLYTVSDTRFLLKEITDLSELSYEVNDYQMDIGKGFIYRVLFVMEDESIFSKVECPIFVNNLSNCSICWRPLESSLTPLLKNGIWKSMRDCLIDSHYYNKTSFDLPFAKNTAYSIAGFVGISNVNIDVYVNSVYYKTIKTNDFGNFYFSYYFPIGSTSIFVIARTDDNSGVSSKSPTITVRTNYIHSWLAALSYQHSQINRENNRFKNLISIDSADESTIKNVYGTLTGLTIGGTESVADFRYFRKGAMDIFSYIGKELAISKLVSLYKNKVPEIDSITYFSNASYENVNIVNMKYIISSSVNTVLPRAKYSYKVTACTLDKQETDGSSIIVDMRCSPQSSSSNSSVTLRWVEEPKANFYKVYRAVYDSDGNVSQYSLLTTNGITSNSFVDTGILTPNESYKPPNFNVSEMNNVSGLECLNRYYVNSWENLLKKPNYFTILITMVGDSDIEPYLLTRFNFLLRNISLAERFYRIMVVNDSSITSYDVSGSIISKITDLKVYN